MCNKMLIFQLEMETVDEEEMPVQIRIIIIIKLKTSRWIMSRNCDIFQYQ